MTLSRVAFCRLALIYMTLSRMLLMTHSDIIVREKAVSRMLLGKMVKQKWCIKLQKNGSKDTDNRILYDLNDPINIIRLN